MSGVQSIQRAFAILRELSLGPAGVTEIAEQTDLPKSTVSRILSALEDEGAVEQRELAGRYQLGVGLAALGDAAKDDTNLAAIVRPYLRELHEEIGESVGFVVRSGRDVYWVDQYDHDAAVQVQDPTGHYGRMHAVPAGLVLLAHLPADEIERYLAEPLEKVNERTIVDKGELRARLDEVATAGVVWSYDDLGDGITAVDVPFRGKSGQYEGALYVNAPSYRFPVPGDAARVEKLLRDAAARLSERLAVH